MRHGHRVRQGSELAQPKQLTNKVVLSTASAADIDVQFYQQQSMFNVCVLFLLSAMHRISCGHRISLRHSIVPNTWLDTSWGGGLGTSLGWRSGNEAGVEVWE